MEFIENIEIVCVSVAGNKETLELNYETMIFFSW